MDIAELAIRVSVVADDVGTALQQAQQEAQEFGKKLEAVAQRPVDIQVNMGGLKEAGAELQAVAQRAATPIDVKIISTGDAKRLIAETETSVRNLAKAASKPIDVKLNASTVIAAVENITRLGTEIDKAGSRLDTLKAKFDSPLKIAMMPDGTKKELEKEIQEVEALLDGLVEAQEAAITSVTGIAEEGGAKIALTFREAGQSIGDGLKAGGEEAKYVFDSIVESATEANSAMQMVGKAGTDAGGQVAAGATVATVALKAQELAAHSLQRVLKRMGTTIIGMGSGLLLGAVMSGITSMINATAEAQKKQEEVRQAAIKSSEEAAQKYTENAASIRKLSEEYAKLGSKIRTSSEDNSFLQLQGDIAKALGMTEDAVKSQAGNIDYLLGKMDDLAKANAALASAESKKAANLLLASAEYTEAAKEFAATRDIITTEIADDVLGKDGISFYHQKRDKVVELGKQLAGDMINGVLEGAAEGKAMAPDAREILTGILLDMQPDIADIDNMMNADQLKDAGAAAAHTLANVAQNIANDPEIATAIETVNGLYQKLLSGELSPEEYAEKGMAQAEVLTGLLAAAFEKAGVDAEIATPAVEAFRNAVVGDQWSLPTDKLLDFSKDAEASGRAAALAAAGYDDLSKKTKEMDNSIKKATSLANHVKDAENAISAYKKLNKEMKSSPQEIAKVGRALAPMGIAFDGTTESMENAEKGLKNFKESLVEQAKTLESEIFDLEAQFADLGDAAYVDGVLTADGSQMREEINDRIEQLRILKALLQALGLSVGEGKGGGGGGGKKDDAEKAAREAEQRRKDALEADYRMIEHKRHLNQITFEEELRMLEDIRKKHQMNAEEIMAWEEKVYDVKKAIRERDSGSIDKMADGVITALTNRYQAMLDAENDRLNASKKAWQQWSDDSVKAIQDQIDALDALSKTEDREKQDQEELRKIAKLRQDIEFEQDEYNRMKLQQQLDQAISSRDDRLRRQAIDDQKEALRAEITAIEERAATEIAALDEEQEALAKAYAERMKTAALQAEAEKLIMSSTQQELIDLIGEFAPEYDALGKTLGEKLLDGFQKKVGNVVDWFKKLNDSLYAIQEQAASDAIAASEAFYSSHANRQNAESTAPVTTVVNQTVNFNEPVDSAGENARRLQQVNEDIGSLLYG